MATASGAGTGGTNIKQFLELAESTGLLSAETITALKAQWPDAKRGEDAGGLAKELVQQGKLTKYQAAGLYQGKPKGLVLRDYVLLDRLGAGGLGTVYKAQNRKSGQIVAIKVLSPAATRSPDAVKRFQREAEAAGRLNHANIVRALDTGEFEGQHFIVMEFVDGVDLSNYVKKQGPLPLEQAVGCIVQVARALAYAHEQGVIHRDIKPGNLLLSRDGHIKILDMGLARLNDPASAATGQAAEGLTQTGQVMGTVDYMAPEQALHTRLADARADVYSLGCTFYRLLTGKIPYEADSLVMKILAHREQPIPSLRASVPAVPVATDLVFQRMMAKKPEDRHQTMTELADDLERSLTTPAAKVAKVALPLPVDLLPQPDASSSSSISLAPLPVRPATTTHALHSQSTTAPVLVSPSDTSVSAIARRKRGVPAWMYAAAALVILGAGGAMFTLMRGGSEPEVAENKVIPATSGGEAANNGSLDKTEKTDQSTGGAMPPKDSSTTIPPAPQPAATGSVAGSPDRPAANPPSRSTPPNFTPAATTSKVTAATPVPPASNTSTSNVDDRELAKWALERDLMLWIYDPATKLTREVNRPEHLPSDEVFIMGLRTKRAGQLRDEDLLKLSEGIDISALVVHGPTITDESLPYFASFPLLNTIYLIDAPIHDTHLAELQKVKRLLNLSLGGSQVTDAGLDALSQLTTVSYLNLSGLQVTDSGVAKLSTLTRLGYLNLSNTQITDEAIATLVNFKNLKRLMITGTKISETGLQQLRAGLPQCELNGVDAPGYAFTLPSRVKRPNLATRTPPAQPVPSTPTLGGESTTLGIIPPTAPENPVASNTPAMPAASSPPATPPALTAPTKTLLDVPDAKAMDEALKLVRSELFSDGYAKAKKPDERLALARTLHDYAVKLNDDPVGKYVILREARDLAAEGGDLAFVSAVSALAELDYKVDGLAWLTEACEMAQKRTLPAAICKSLANGMLSNIDVALDADKFELAERLMAVALATARKAQDPVTLKTVVDRDKQFSKDKQQRQAVAKARETLKEKPDDSAANLALGKFLCFNEANWSEGLACLAKGSDTTLKELAEKSIVAPTDTDEIVTLADQWWAKADKANGPAKKELTLGALYWYEQVADKVSGLPKTKVDKRIADAKVVTAGLGPTAVRSPAKTTSLAGGPPPRAVAPASAAGSTFNTQIMQTPNPQSYAALSEWVFQRNGNLMVRYSGPTSSGTRFVNKSTDFPQGTYQIYAVHLTSGSPGVKDADLATLATIPWITGVTIFNQSSNVTDAGISALASMPMLDTLDVSSTRSISDASLIALARATRLKHLSINYASITGTGLGRLASLPNLTYLSVAGNPITDPDLASIGQLRQVTDLHLRGTRITDAGLTHLRGLVNLDYIDLGDTKISDSGLAQLRGLPKLRTLNLNDTLVTGSGFGSLESLPISALYLDSSKITDTTLDSLLRMPQLRTLFAQNTAITDMGIGKLAAHPSISMLELNGCNVSDLSIPSLLRMPRLRTLYVRKTRITDAGVQSIQSQSQIRVYNN
jgi:serine/threonine protein kinase/Leucine-rich repeat (LRR) protein